MLVCGLMSVIILNNLVKEWSESIVRVVGSGINTDTGVGPLSSREDTLSEGESELISSVLALFPDVFGKALLEE